MISYEGAKQWWINVWERMYMDYADNLNQGTYIQHSVAMVNSFGPDVDGGDGTKLHELGVGSGRNIHYFHEIYPNWQYSGNDINPRVHEIIEKSYPGILEYADIVVADAMEYLEAMEPVDTILTHGFLIHIPDDVIDKMCTLMAQKARFLMLHEATGRLHGAVTVPHEYIRFERNYFDKFPRCMLKKHALNLNSCGRVYSFYLFEKMK